MYQAKSEAKKGNLDEFFKGKDWFTNLVITLNKYINITFSRVEAIL